MNELFQSFPYLATLIAGLLSFLSPCVLPLIPSYFSFLTGVSYEEMQEKGGTMQLRLVMVSHSLMFTIGFSIVFVALGSSASVIGKVFLNYQEWLRIIGGTVIIFFGLFVLELIKMPGLLADKRFQGAGKPAGYLGSTTVGMGFAAGWTPCIGPILGTVLMYAGTQDSSIYGGKLLAVYSLGLAIPFLAAALAFNVFLTYSKRVRKHMKKVVKLSGGLLILFGILLLTDQLTRISALFPSSPLSFWAL